MKNQSMKLLKRTNQSNTKLLQLTLLLKPRWKTVTQLRTGICSPDPHPTLLLATTKRIIQLQVITSPQHQPTKKPMLLLPTPIKLRPIFTAKTETTLPFLAPATKPLLRPTTNPKIPTIQSRLPMLRQLKVTRTITKHIPLNLVRAKKHFPVIIGRYQVTDSRAFLPKPVDGKEPDIRSVEHLRGPNGQEYVVYYLPYGQPLPVPVRKRRMAHKAAVHRVRRSPVEGGRRRNGRRGHRRANYARDLLPVSESF